MNSGAKRVFFGKLFYFWIELMGVALGCVLAMIFRREMSGASFAGGFAHAFPGAFSLSDFAAASFWQFLPLFVLGYAACGALFSPTAVCVIAIRAVLGGYVALTAVKIFRFDDPLTSLLLILFLLFELATLSLFASCAHRAEGFSSLVMKKGLQKKALCRFSSDLLFYFGLILFFYIARGCVVALLNT